MGAEGRDLYGRDSISSCQTYSNPYDLRPDAEKARRKLAENSIALGADVIESKQMKLERELVEKFQKNQFMVFGNEKMVGILTGGKFIVIALVMPAYLFFYGLPRWLLQNTIPPAASLIVQAAQHVQGIVRFSVQWLQNTYKAVTHKSEGMFAWNRGSEQSKHSLNGFLMHGLQFLTAQTAGLNKGMQQAALGAFQKTNSILLGVYHFVADPIHKFFAAQLQSLKKMGGGASEIYANIATMISQKVGQIGETFKHYYEDAFKYVSRGYNQVAHLANRQYENLQQAVVNQAKNLAEKALAVKNWTVNAYHSVADRFIEHSKDRLKEMWHGVQSVGQTVTSPVVATAVWAQEQFINLAVVGRQAAVYTTEKSKQSFIWLIHRALPVLINMLPKWLNPLYWFNKGRSFGNVIKRLSSKVAAYATRKLQLLYAIALSWLDRVGQFLGRIIKFMKAITLFLHRRYIKPILPYLTLEAALNAVKVTWICLRIIGRYVQQLGRALIADMTS